MKRNKRSEAELAQIRRNWQIQQKQLEAHERRREGMIKKFEMQSTRRLKPSTGSMSLFNEPEDTQINPTELRKIKVDIHRNIPGKSVGNKLQRDIINPEDVVVKRRMGEGSRPIFEREEVTKTASNTEDVEERRTVATAKDTNLDNKPQTSKRGSALLSPTRNRSHGHRRTSSCHCKHEDYKYDNRESRRSTGSRSRKRKEDRRRTPSRHVRDEERRLKDSRDHARSSERDQVKWDRDSHHSKSIRGRRSRERRIPSQQIPVIEQVPIPIYCGNFPQGPVMIDRLVPIRGQVAFGGSRHPMWPLIPFGPRFPSGINMYRLRPPRNPRGFRPQY